MIFNGWFVKSRLKKALDMLNCGMYAQAESELRGILLTLTVQKKDDQKRIPVLFYLAECYMAMGDEKFENKDFRGALNDFEKGAALGVDFPDIYFRIGRVCLEMSEWDQAEEALDKALSLNPRYVKAHLLMSKVYALKERYDLSVKEYRILGEQGVPCNQELYLKGVQYAGNGEIQKGYEILKSCFEEKPDPVQALYLKGLRCYQNKNYAGAVLALKKAQENQPGYPDIFNLLGVACCGQKSYAEAEGAFQKAIKLNSRYMEPRLNLAFLYEILQDMEKAEGVFQDILSMDPGNVIALEGLEGLKNKKG
ncbi:MAG: hypothetical protein CO150_03940 [Nitrospirae bacterium CG_4_9_14_3_um_filter_53_35]|nr:MAG: hypothetical protein AUK29_04880 [Nitrospirae bacterium CG2_30_53_67]PIS37228.1 MAG: hypothetical protein COT35_07140 [Nitrospirae bacterium CG08_land_8_20_14_0_20_52_24]PIV83024.1 MAG: hypothetical protein COW52_10500 [Nitrospirae bacterium CG17_big_fil_post_rev_8_21_14_2_50_50_9]PIW85088.1 MAG: hypothetical protein COZ95_06465 [Nitrospirae bacterium CG_4_8_14_3_um_filter_50_41]PIX85953.1 MAG: hypothetical protein COZ32_05830 [Nitrospirae bacterium CG_4_10_14_3_um_filter_53_41]PJA7603